MIVHIFADTPHHYEPMKRFLLSVPYTDKQAFWVKSSEQALLDPDLITYQSVDALFALIGQADSDTSFIFHGLFDVHIWKKLLFHPVSRRCSCVIWGGELYRHFKKDRSFKEYIAQALHALMLRKFKHVQTLNMGDAKLVSKALKRKGVSVLPYPLIGVATPEPEQRTSNTIRVLVGNSASSSNRHKEALESLLPFKALDIEIVVPLNYAGEASYVNEVTAYGETLFGEKFKPIKHMLNKEEYDALLNSVDMAVFSQHRQQGLYVAYTMFLTGKPMFMLSTTTSFTNLTELGFEIDKTEFLSQLSVESFFEKAFSRSKANQQLMQSHFTEHALAPKWAALFESLECN
ncbi:4-alpha-L-fucosyltransferase [Pseudoalteromonas aurantia]|uniref:TDP-N-acetylfucosamine:lipid II N-acetylfucosaminyltransferase n=1 Tax=Pseudoalteromonas aurantia TaxID=43654 RepID=UPI00110B5059|nr:TDP-N-acetylfucosamine:lipid II N-acetylfucosaminyltransferase [Pseudoalteromonas aurantia]TMO67087.1 4-alpha-L-fucosyltransferase [Pseudoalteromonas aurantia]